MREVTDVAFLTKKTPSTSHSGHVRKLANLIL